MRYFVKFTSYSFFLFSCFIKRQKHDKMIYLINACQQLYIDILMFNKRFIKKKVWTITMFNMLLQHQETITIIVTKNLKHQHCCLVKFEDSHRKSNIMSNMFKIHKNISISTLQIILIFNTRVQSTVELSFFRKITFEHSSK